MESYLSAALLPLLAWLVHKVVSRIRDNRHRAPYPPGPKPKPLIANLLDFPQVDAAQKYLEMSKAYNSAFYYSITSLCPGLLLYISTQICHLLGDILHLEAMGEHIVIVNKLEDAEELLDVRAKMYSDRNSIPIIKMCVFAYDRERYATALKLIPICSMGWDYNFALHQHTDHWRRHRKIAQQNFRAAEASKYLPVQMEKLHQMLRALAETPEQFDMHNKKLSFQTVYLLSSSADFCSLQTFNCDPSFNNVWI